MGFCTTNILTPPISQMSHKLVCTLDAGFEFFQQKNDFYLGVDITKNHTLNMSICQSRLNFCLITVYIGKKFPAHIHADKYLHLS
jgi:hypothetical protein